MLGPLVHVSKISQRREPSFQGEQLAAHKAKLQGENLPGPYWRRYKMSMRGLVLKRGRELRAILRCV